MTPSEMEGLLNKLAARSEELDRKITLVHNLIIGHQGIQLGLPTQNLPHPNMHIAVTYTITNGTTDRTYDADATSTAELADILYTLIQDLKLLGLIG